MVRGSLLLVALLSTAHGKRRRKLGDHPTPDEKDPGLLQRLRAGEGKPKTECEACVHLAAEAAAYEAHPAAEKLANGFERAADAMNVHAGWAVAAAVAYRSSPSSGAPSARQWRRSWWRKWIS